MEKFLSVCGSLTPLQSKSNVDFRFFVSEEQKLLSISFAYEPKALDDREIARKLIEEGIRKYGAAEQERLLKNWEQFLPVNNLITITVEDPYGFRGCAHRQNPRQEHCLSPQDASLGFIKGRIFPGPWTITISAHAIVTTRCTYALRVTGGDPNV
jgi:hypothetical protein